MTKKTTLKRNKIKKRIRKIVFGTKVKPRLTVFRSNKEIYAQIIDDVSANTIVAASSTDKDLKLKIQELRDAGEKAHSNGDHSESEKLLNEAISLINS
jgi:ribosomal protein L18